MMSKQLFIQTEKQREWLKKLETLEQNFKEQAQIIDEASVFPFENFKKLREIGYTKITLPKEFGGEGFSLYDTILLHETLASYCGSTGLAASWTIQNVGEIFENRYWDEDPIYKGYQRHYETQGSKECGTNGQKPNRKGDVSGGIGR